MPAGPRAAALSLEVLGRTVLDRTLDTLKALPDLDEVIVIDSPLPLGSGITSPLRLGRGRGGGTILVCEPDRPLLSLAMLTDFLERTHDVQVAALVSPASDTYKVIRAGRVETTLDRASLWELQGLSRFNHGTFDTLHDLDAARMAGIPIRLVQGDPTNFPVRSLEDARVAALVLGR